MTKAIFTYSPGSQYDDLPEERYHFPKQYLGAARAAIGDWVVYYQPRRGARLSNPGYFAIARVADVVPDPALEGHYYAYVTDYLDLASVVPHVIEGRYVGATASTAFQRALRGISDEEFDFILRLGMAPVIAAAPNTEGLVGPSLDPYDVARPIQQILTARPVRDAAFARQVVTVAYQGRCAITGLRITNGFGRAEVEAAHIKPVAAAGPDSPRNGLALSRTVHWMFDRGLVSADDDFNLLLAKKVPEDALRLINTDRRLIVPENPQMQPAAQFLAYHRNNVFKG